MVPVTRTVTGSTMLAATGDSMTMRMPPVKFFRSVLSVTDRSVSPGMGLIWRAASIDAMEVALSSPPRRLMLR